MLFIGMLSMAYYVDTHTQSQSGMEIWQRECMLKHATPFLMSYMMLAVHFFTSLGYFGCFIALIVFYPVCTNFIALTIFSIGVPITAWLTLFAIGRCTDDDFDLV